MSDDLARIEATLGLSGDGLDPLEFSRATSLVPTSMTKKGEPRSDGRGSYPFTTWALSVSDTAEAVDPLVGRLLDLVEPCTELIREYAARTGIDCSVICTVTISESRPVLDLTHSTLVRLVALGCDARFDIYDYS